MGEKAYYIPRKLTQTKPDKCRNCPLVGLIPKKERRRGLREKYLCLGVFEPVKDANGFPILDDNGEEILDFPRIKSKRINVSWKTRKESGHLYHRPCDYIYKLWAQRGYRSMRSDIYMKYRLPFEEEKMKEEQPTFKFKDA